MTILAFSATGLLGTLIWLALAAMAFWVWSGTKSKASLMTLIGAGILGLFGLFGLFGILWELYWLGLVGAALLAFGYYLTVKPIVDQHVNELKAKAKAATSKGSSTSSTPPPSSPST